MLTILQRWVAAWARHRREAHLVADLSRLNDHHLADIGLRRDQLQPDGIHALDLPPLPRPEPKRPLRHRTAMRPSIQGCG